MSSAKYQGRYSGVFKEELEEICFSNPRVKEMVQKAILFILEEPYFETKEFPISGKKYRRKHVVSNDYRILYRVDEAEKIVWFSSLRHKDKDTYQYSVEETTIFSEDI